MSAIPRTDRRSQLRLRRRVRSIVLALTVAVGLPTFGSLPAASAEGNAAPRTTVVSNQEFYAYAKAGENVGFRVSVASQPTNGTRTVAYTVRLQGMGGVDRSCRIRAGAPNGTSCNLGPITTSRTGLWRASITSSAADIDGSNARPGAHPALNWNVAVRSGTTPRPGRVYAPKRYSIYNAVGSTPAQIRNGSTDVNLWYLDDRGWLYAASYKAYNGVYSRLFASSLGVTATKTGLPTYFSTTNKNPQQYRIDDPKSQYFRIFFQQPDATMPATSPSWDGRTRPLNRSGAPLAPKLTAMTFTPKATPARDHAGTFSWTVADYTGPVDLTIDTDLSGTVTAADKKVTQVTTGGTMSVAWDGRAANGSLVAPDRAVKAWVRIKDTGEIHFVNSDVELRGGLSVRRLNGPTAGRTTLYWDDTRLSQDASHDRVTSRRDGRAGVDSSAAGGVHDLPVGSGAFTGWGNTRYIDDWMKVPLPAEIVGEAPVVVPPKADVRILKTRVGTGPVEVGDQVTWKVEVDNAGPDTATDVVVKDYAPRQVDPATVRFSDPSKGTASGATWNVGELAKGEHASATVTATVVADASGHLTGPIVNLATVTSPDDADVPPTKPADCQDNATLPTDADNCDVVSIPVLPPVLKINKELEGSVDLHGDEGTVTWRIEVINAGKSRAEAVKVVDHLPDGYLEGSVTGTPSKGAFDATTATWTVGTLAPGERQHLVLSADFPRSVLEERVRNVATVGNPELPPPGSPSDCTTNATLAGDDDQCDDITVQVPPPAGPGLPETGGPNRWLALSGGALILGGLVLIARALSARYRGRHAAA